MRFKKNLKTAIPEMLNKIYNKANAHNNYLLNCSNGILSSFHLQPKPRPPYMEDCKENSFSNLMNNDF